VFWNKLGIFPKLYFFQEESMKLTKMVSFFGLALLLAAELVFAGGGQQGSAQGTEVPAAGPVKLDFACWGITEGSTKPAFEAMIAGFQKKYPNIQVETTGYAYNNVQEQLLLRAANNTLPDVAQIAPIWVASLAKMNVIAPMDQTLPPEVFNDYFKSALSGTTIGGHVMSAPWIIGPVLMFYNKALLAKAGYNAPPKTWGEMLEMSKKVAGLGKDAGGNQIYGRTISTKLLPGAGYFFLVDIWQNGGEFTDANGKIVFNSPGTVAAFKSAQDQFAQNIVAPGLEVKENRTLFALGQAAFHFDLASQVGTFIAVSPKGEEFKKDMAVMQIPGARDSNGISFSSDHHLIIAKNSKYIKEAAQMVDFLSGPEGMDLYSANGVSILPGRNSAMKIPYFSNLDEFSKPYLDALPVTRSLPVQSPDFLNACEIIIESVQRVCINKEDPATVVARTEKTIKELYGQ
jgi:ABC-type glycerol-3-phosphate transport system substrate-binding protein